jgi:hypothetical protein
MRKCFIVAAVPGKRFLDENLLAGRRERRKLKRESEKVRK